MIEVLLCLFLIFCNGFFVAAEFSLVRVRVSQLEVLRDEGNKTADRVLKIVAKIDSYLSAVQLGITIASLGIGALALPNGNAARKDCAPAHVIGLEHLEPLIRKTGADR